jgi:hypothetical protein
MTRRSQVSRLFHVRLTGRRSQSLPATALNLSEKQLFDDVIRPWRTAQPLRLQDEFYNPVGLQLEILAGPRVPIDQSVAWKKIKQAGVDVTAEMLAMPAPRLASGTRELLNDAALVITLGGGVLALLKWGLLTAACLGGAVLLTVMAARASQSAKPTADGRARIRVVGGGVASLGLVAVAWLSASTPKEEKRPAATPRRPPVASATATPTVELDQGPAGSAGYRYAVTLKHFRPTSTATVQCLDGGDKAPFYSFQLYVQRDGTAFTQDYCYSGVDVSHWVTVNGIESEHVRWHRLVTVTADLSRAIATLADVRQAANRGPDIEAGRSINVSCRVRAEVHNPAGTPVTLPAVFADWYRIASPPWNDNYFAVASSFSDLRVGGRRSRHPPRVPLCPKP